MSIENNLSRIRTKLSGQTLIAATKYGSVSQIRELYAAGIQDVGENRVDAFLDKLSKLQDLPLIYHFIGQLQTNKVKSVINEIDYLHSLDRISLAEAIQKHRNAPPLKCFVEVHISDETTKSGVLPELTVELCKKIGIYDKIVVVGLMGMAPLTDDSDKIRTSFMTLKRLQSEVKALCLPNAPCMYLSMGMSSDYEIAIACGATHLRLGSILFRNEE